LEYVDAKNKHSAAERDENVKADGKLKNPMF
jgi:hypothetical protein